MDPSITLVSRTQAQLKETFDLDVSHDLISKITDGVLEEVKEWQNRPLDRVYPVIFLDALDCKVRQDGTVRNKAAHLAVGVDADGKKDNWGIAICRPSHDDHEPS